MKKADIVVGPNQLWTATSRPLHEIMILCYYGSLLLSTEHDINQYNGLW